MKRYYEKQWQNALDGARIQPSDSLWENIENSIEGNNSNRMWVTILLVAATITIAFAFPLTIGNSSFEARPETYQNLSQVEIKDTNTEYKSEVDKADSKPEHDEIASKKNNNKSNAESLSPVSTIPAYISENNVDISKEDEQAAVYLAKTQGFGLSSFKIGVKPVDEELDRYYFIPYYMPTSKEKRNLLASMNMGAGSTSAGNGVNGFTGLESADMLAASPNFNDNNSDNRTESQGYTYYVGAGVELPIGNRWSLISGLGYLTQTANGTSNIVLDNGENYLPLGVYDPVLPGTVFLSEPYGYTVKNNYLNIPLTLKYSVINRKFKLRTGFGLSTDLMLSHNYSSDAYGSANYDPSLMGFNPVMLVGLINLDISYNLSNQYSVALETGVRKGITAIDNSQEYYPSSFTVGIILFYKIQR